jgi:glucose uptake protein
MFVPETFLIALVMMVACAVCWGSWANTYKLTKGYRFELFYWDYAFGILLISLALALTLGSIHSDARSFLANVRSADSSNIIYALIGGIIFNVANLLLVAGIEMAGLAVAFPIAIGEALVVGVVLSYLLQPKGDLMLLTVGVALAVIAIIMDGLAYANLSGASKSVSRKSIGICLISGLLMGFFPPFVTRAITAGNQLGPYSISVFFALGLLLCCGLFNVYLMKRPLVGEPVNFSGWFSARPHNHLLGLVGGAIWGLGAALNFVAASFVGVAISYAIGQSATMVAALWGVLIWKEFRGAKRQALVYLALMFSCYLLALIVIARAYSAP